MVRAHCRTFTATSKSQLGAPWHLSSRLASCTANLCFPFLCHGEKASVGQVGARTVAWALTAAAYARSPLDLVALGMNASESVQLRRDVVLAERIYKMVSSEFGKDVSVAAVEERFGLQWREVDVQMQDGTVRRDDPYYAQLLSKTVADSFQKLLFELPYRLAALPGMEPSQTIDAMRTQINHAANVLYNRLGPYIAGTLPHATHEMLVKEATTCAEELIAMHVQPTRKRISMHVAGLRVLQLLCSEGRSNEPVADILMKHSETLQFLASHPPSHLIEELNREKVPFAELADFLVCTTRPGIRGASAIPPNGAARELAVQKWTTRYGETVLRCLVSVRQALNTLAAASNTACTWHGVLIAHKNDMVVDVAVQTGGPMAALTCPQAAHSHALDDLMLIATSTTDMVSLLVPRMARVVLTMVENHHLTIRTVKAELLLPLIQRWNCTAVVKREQLMAQCSAMTVDNAFDDDDDDDEHMEDQESSATSSTLGTPSTVFSGHSVLVPDTVPLSLERDHAIVWCIKDLIKQQFDQNGESNGLVVVSVKSVVARAFMCAPTLLNACERSTSQSVGCVYGKIVNALGETSSIYYYKTTMAWKHADTIPRPKSAGLVVTSHGVKPLLNHLDWLVDEMRGNGTEFAKTWFPSRAARSHSRRIMLDRRKLSDCDP